MPGNLSHSGATVTSRALALLGAFDEDHRRLTLTELAQRAELPVPTAHRLVGELAEWGAVTRTSTGEYVVGRRLWDIGLLAPAQTGLRQIASPYLHDLYGATLATIHLAVREGTEVLYLDRLRGHASVPIVSDIGSRLPMHCTGVGKVLLAHAPADVQAQVLANLTRVTPYTVVQPGTLRRQLDKALVNDFATTGEEMSLGACSLGVPIRSDGKVVASVGIVVPTLRRDRDKLVTAMQVTARSIGRALERSGEGGSTHA
jgi:DNA-binding IclR family transcriptional regulator